ncbi:hypothetical protein ANN_00402 [Periplaneta americana]|uniref:Uncharacterized protein n=1 Tax=Periplaneta americana TaxID=6978 RepID=A0ABQ8TQP0_PERAM|nr:hypothetical protein ANN_00402 [Periplaneta americana]
MVNGIIVSGRRYQMIDDIKIYGSYEETKRKAENRKDWRKLGGVGMVLALVFLFAMRMLVSEAQVPFPGGCPTVKAMQDFDVLKFLGLWYEQKRYFAIFEAGGICVTANYTDKGNGAIKVNHTEYNTLALFTNQNFRSQFTVRLPWLVLLAQSLEFTVSRTPDLQRQSTELRTQVPQLRSTALELWASDAHTAADTLKSNSGLKAGFTATQDWLACCPTTTTTLLKSDSYNSITGTATLIDEGTLGVKFRSIGHVARMGESRNAYRVLVGRPEGKRPLGRPRHIWGDNIKMDLREVGYDDRDWINLAQNRDRWRAYVRVAMNLRKMKIVEKVQLCKMVELDVKVNMDMKLEDED